MKRQNLGEIVTASLSDRQIRRLIADDAFEVRAALSRNPNPPGWARDRLALDSSARVRQSLLWQYPELPAQVVLAVIDQYGTADVESGELSRQRFAPRELRESRFADEFSDWEIRDVMDQRQLSGDAMATVMARRSEHLTLRELLDQAT